MNANLAPNTRLATTIAGISGCRTDATQAHVQGWTRVPDIAAVQRVDLGIDALVLETDAWERARDAVAKDGGVGVDRANFVKAHLVRCARLAATIARVARGCADSSQTEFSRVTHGSNASAVVWVGQDVDTLVVEADLSRPANRSAAERNQDWVADAPVIDTNLARCACHTSAAVRVSSGRAGAQDTRFSRGTRVPNGTAIVVVCEGIDALVV